MPLVCWACGVLLLILTHSLLRFREGKQFAYGSSAWPRPRPGQTRCPARGAGPPEALCAVLLRGTLWLEARMDDQALVEGSVVFKDEDDPARGKSPVSHSLGQEARRLGRKCIRRACNWGVCHRTDKASSGPRARCPRRQSPSCLHLGPGEVPLPPVSRMCLCNTGLASQYQAPSASLTCL